MIVQFSFSFAIQRAVSEFLTIRYRRRLMIKCWLMKPALVQNMMSKLENSFDFELQT